MTTRLHLRLRHCLARQHQVSVCRCLAPHCCADHVLCLGALHMRGSGADMPEQLDLPFEVGSSLWLPHMVKRHVWLRQQMDNILSCDDACMQHAALPGIAPSN